jgi:hypothetical protein
LSKAVKTSFKLSNVERTVDTGHFDMTEDASGVSASVPPPKPPTKKGFCEWTTGFEAYNLFQPIDARVWFASVFVIAC